MRQRKEKETKDRYECSWSATYQEWHVFDNEKDENSVLSNDQMIQMLANEIARLKKRLKVAEQTADRAETAIISKGLPY